MSARRARQIIASILVGGSLGILGGTIAAGAAAGPAVAASAPDMTYHG